MDRVITLLLTTLIGVVCCNVEIEMGIDDCHGDTHVLSDDEGQITSYNYPGQYQANCTWTSSIQTASGSPLRLEFNGLGLGLGDMLKINDNGGFSRTWISGDSLPPEPFDLYSKVNISFTSNADNERGIGVSISWRTQITVEQTTPLLPDNTERRNIIEGSEVYLQSPNYPSTYPNNAIQHWILTGPTGSRIQILFKYLKTEMGKDKLQIYSGPDLLTEELIGEYSGDHVRNLPPALISTSNRVHVKFTSDNWLSFKGFSILYGVYEPPQQITTTEAPYKMSSDVLAIIIVLVILLTIAIVMIIVYFFWYKPKMAAKEAAVYGTALSGRPATARPMTGRRPGTASQRPGTASQRPGTASQQPGTAIQRPGTAIQRPGTASQRPGTAARRPGTAMQKADILTLPSDRPGTAMMHLTNEDENNSAGKRPMSSLVRSRPSARIDYPALSAPPQILVNDGTIEEEDGRDETKKKSLAYLNDSIDEILQEGSPRRLNTQSVPGGKLPPISQGKLPPLTSSRQNLTSQPVPSLNLEGLSSSSPRKVQTPTTLFTSRSNE